MNPTKAWAMLAIDAPSRIPVSKGATGSSKDTSSSMRKRGKAVIDFLDDLRKDVEERKRQRQQELDGRKRHRMERNSVKTDQVVGGRNTGIFGAIIAANKMKEELEKATACMPSPTRRKVLRGITEEICKLGNDFVTAERSQDSDGSDSPNMYI